MSELISTQRNRIPLSRRIDRPLVAFWLLAYAIAWGVFGLLDRAPARRGKRPRALAYGQSISICRRQSQLAGATLDGSLPSATIAYHKRVAVVVLFAGMTLDVFVYFGQQCCCQHSLHASSRQLV